MGGKSRPSFAVWQNLKFCDMEWPSVTALLGEKSEGCKRSNRLSYGLAPGWTRTSDLYISNV